MKGMFQILERVFKITKTYISYYEIEALTHTWTPDALTRTPVKI